MTTNMIIKEFKAVTRNSLRGFAEVQMPSGLIFHDVSINCTAGRWWASPASKPVLDRDGKHKRDLSGRGEYLPIVSFASRELRDLFSDAVISALRDFEPAVFVDEPDK